MSEADNVRRWDGHTPGMYEVWYLTFNHPESETGFWIRYTLEAPQNAPPYAQMWFAYFDARSPQTNFGIHQRMAIDALSSTHAPFSVRIGDNTLTHASARGRLNGAGHETDWDLSWTPSPVLHRHLPAPMYLRGGLGETTVLSPNLDIALRGTVTVDGRRLELDGAPGGQTHLWGRKHAHRWAWGHCNAFCDSAGNERPDACFEALSVDLVRGGRAIPRLTPFTLYLDGRAHRFTGFLDLLRTHADFGPGRFAFRARGAKLRIDGEFTSRPEHMVLTPYEDPDGAPCWCANTEVADLRIVLQERVGLASWRERDVLISRRAAHFEVGSHTRPSVAMAAHLPIGEPPVLGETG